MTPATCSGRSASSALQKCSPRDAKNAFLADANEESLEHQRQGRFYRLAARKRNPYKIETCPCLAADAGERRLGVLIEAVVAGGDVDVARSTSLQPSRSRGQFQQEKLAAVGTSTHEGELLRIPVAKTWRPLLRRPLKWRATSIELIGLALELPEDDRLHIAAELLASVKLPGVMSVDDPGFVEAIRRRCDEIDAGKAPLVDYNTAMERIRGNLNRSEQP